MTLTSQTKAEKLANEWSRWSFLSKYAADPDLTDGKIKTIEDRWKIDQEIRELSEWQRATRVFAWDPVKRLETFERVAQWHFPGYKGTEIVNFVLVKGRPAIWFQKGDPDLNLVAPVRGHVIERWITVARQPTLVAGREMLEVKSVKEKK